MNVLVSQLCLLFIKILTLLLGSRWDILKTTEFIFQSNVQMVTLKFTEQIKQNKPQSTFPNISHQTIIVSPEQSQIHSPTSDCQVSKMASE